MRERWNDYSDIYDPAVLDKAGEVADFFAEQYDRLDTLPRAARQELETDLRSLAARATDDMRVFDELNSEHREKFATLMASPNFKGMATYYVLSEFLVGGTMIHGHYPGSDLVGLGQAFSRVSEANGFPLPADEKIRTEGILAFQESEFQESLFETSISPLHYMETLRRFRDEQTNIALDKREN